MLKTFQVYKLGFAYENSGKLFFQTILKNYILKLFLKNYEKNLYFLFHGYLSTFNC